MNVPRRKSDDDRSKDDAPVESPAPAPTPSPSAPKLRGRPPVISSEHLLEIARAVFLERGIRATTAEVAERAGISEGTIFHRFKSKDALFRSAMRFDPEQMPEPFLMLPEGGVGDLRATLIDLGTRMLAIGRVALPMMMMSWSNPAGDYSIDKLINRPHGYRRALQRLLSFFAAEVEAGRLRADPEALARMFMGSLHHYCMTELIFSGESPQKKLVPTTYVESLVDVMLNGASTGPARPHVAATTPSASSSSRARKPRTRP